MYKNQKVVVVLPAYNAALTLEQTYQEIPFDLVDEVILCDDASRDHTVATAEKIGIRHIIRHEKNKGYGGNQKAGYTYAINHGWDVVVLLHGDGQYAPEIMGDIIDPIVNGDADAVFGSRMMHRGEARKGGMPMYKYVGNKVLTTFQNRLAGLRLSEWHSGYRAYRLDRLGLASLREMSDVFDFDTEIILHLAKHKLRISEIAIPTFYGDEKCHVNGLRYAADVVVDVVRFRARGVFGGRELVNAA